MLIINVDDDSDDREVFSDAVKAVDPQLACVLFESGQELLDFLETTIILPDYIFIDINMPKMNGYECARTIRSNKKFDQVQIVMYSTAFNPNDALQFAKLGSKFLIKPSQFKKLVQAIKDIIE